MGAPLGQIRERMCARTYYLRTTGCQLNEADSHRLAQQPEFAGYPPADSAEQGDIVVLNACLIPNRPKTRPSATRRAEGG